MATPKDREGNTPKDREVNEKKKNSKPYRLYYYLVDPVRCDYIELPITGMQLRLDRSEKFIRDHAEKEDLFIIDGRGYYLTLDFGRIWELL